MPDFYEDLANEMGNTDRYVQPDEEDESSHTPSGGLIHSYRLVNLAAKWRKYAEAMMNHGSREMHIAAAAQLTCADELELLAIAIEHKSSKVGEKK